MLSHLDDVITKHRSLLQRMPFTQVVDKARYRVLVDETTVIDTVHGYQMYVDPEDTSVSRRLWRDGDFQPTLTEYFKSVIEPGMTVVDVGAHIGYFSLLFGKLVGTGGGFGRSNRCRVISAYFLATSR
ncbi:hypothetical protein ACFQH3_01265 [Haladaptatus sp. GCM10025707]|uniref:hypothetical protein n=1 Tax=Haladaptatus sp. GCM10025707 TaxID=3252658 RepID=UPI003607704D